MRRPIVMSCLLLTAGFAMATSASTTDLAGDQGIGPEGGIPAVGGVPIACQASGADIVLYELSIGSSISAHVRTVGTRTDLVCPGGSVQAKDGHLKILIMAEDSVPGNYLKKMAFRVEHSPSGASGWLCIDVWGEDGSFLPGATCETSWRSRDYYWSIPTSFVLFDYPGRLTGAATSDMSYLVQGQTVHVVDATLILTASR